MSTIGVIGSRSWSDYSTLKEILDAHKPTSVVSGGAGGADSLAQRYAKERGMPIKIWYPNYNAWGRKAPLYRNANIVKDSDFIIAFWDGRSRGTKYTINLAREDRKTVFRVTQDGAVHRME